MHGTLDGPPAAAVPLEAVSRVYGSNGNSVVAMNDVTLKVPASVHRGADGAAGVVHDQRHFRAEERPKKCGPPCHKCPTRFVNQLRAVPRTAPS